ncbi:MAG: DUF5119 domain-containing protein [Prevotella sp.]|jgi:hypothetical protein|nr:DUF5119 domain-containing protein [Prevotella sp.]
MKMKLMKMKKPVTKYKLEVAPDLPARDAVKSLASKAVFLPCRLVPGSTELQVDDCTKQPAGSDPPGACRSFIFNFQRSVSRLRYSFSIYILHFSLIFLLFPGCIRELSPDDPCPPGFGDKAVRIVIHWEETPADTRPDGMSVFWYTGGQSPFIGDYAAGGGPEWLPGGVFIPLCIDYYGNSSLDIRNTGARESFEVYNIPRESLYNDYADPVPGETTVAEATSPYTCYTDSEAQNLDTRYQNVGDTLTVHFYPKNVLREFTFMIYGVEGAKNMARNSGAVSGMSASYFPASKSLSETPSTILFTRITPIRDGQNYPWSNEQKTLFSQKNPDWQSSDPAIGWTGDWVAGKFSVFGPVKAGVLNIRLTVEALTDGNRYYYGKWDDTVGAQIQEAMGGPSGHGTAEEQQDWRNRNGGFDIILFNDGRLAVPEDPDDPGDDGGFIVDDDDWGESVPVPEN